MAIFNSYVSLPEGIRNTHTDLPPEPCRVRYVILSSIRSLQSAAESGCWWPVRKVTRNVFRCWSGGHRSRTVANCGFEDRPTTKYNTYHIIWLVVWNMTFIFPYIGNSHPNWLIFFRGVETTNQLCFPKHISIICIYIYMCIDSDSIVVNMII